MKALLIPAMLCMATVTLAQGTFSVKNETALPRKEVISIPHAQFQHEFGLDTNFVVKDHAGNPIVHQVEYRGESQAQNILILVEVADRSSSEYKVEAGKPLHTPSKTYARYVPERYDDFAWENDKVGFRMYGKALEGRADDAQGMDYWAKRTDKLVINSWYKSEDYHRDHGEGLDYYSVGNTLGAGDLAIFEKDKLQYTKHYRNYQILDNGPLRTTFMLSYDPQDFNGQTIALKKTIQLDAGSHFNKITVQLDNSEKKVTRIVLGIAKRKEQQPKYAWNPEKRTLSYWEPNVQENGHTGIALILPKGKHKLHANDAAQFLVETDIRNGKSFVYYNGAAWDREGTVANAEQWNTFVRDESIKLEKPLHVKFN
ncbi:DUF4861 family protein [Sphingobacterium lactis]|uniref:DUF4861 family protein n=1 Tax=Sphingobacterium lactis TaxID=797291 RepID=UPI003EC88233